MTDRTTDAAAGDASRRLFVYNGGFAMQPRLRRILSLAGWNVRTGLPGPGDTVGVWGQSPTAWRGERVAARRGASLLRIEDAFLRSVRPGRDGDPPIGLTLDGRGMHYDPAQPSDLEVLLATHPFDDTALLDRARGLIETIARDRLSKYNHHDPDLPAPKPGYVLVIDQTAGDASVRASGATRADFLEMLSFAQAEHPSARILIKTHPETATGHRPGHFQPTDAVDRIALLDTPVCPHATLAGAVAVYTVSSQLGFEAIFAGHRPVVFGQPFYAGWGLTDDRRPVDRRQRTLTRAQLFAGAMLLYPTWYDPNRDRLCSAEEATLALGAQVRRWREDRHGWRAHAMSSWKRAPLAKVFGSERPMRFSGAPHGRREMIWASKAPPDSPFVRVEDGFLRSRGLGADLVPPLSLVLDDLGIYYDPTRPSRLETLIAEACRLPDSALHRAERLIRTLTTTGVTKYNLGGEDVPPLSQGRRLLVPGQVADDASIRLGTGDIADNAALLARVRAENPDAAILWKPHPDVVAGLRPGAVPDADRWADAETQAGADAALAAVDEVWTMTSGIGFEALLRGKRVVCLGRPFYAGWGLTEDRLEIPRRAARPSLEALAHAVLIDYPRYFDPVSGLPCPVEVVVERLGDGRLPHPGWRNRALAKLQGRFAGHAWIWRGR